jgi:hypothetical protein
MNSPPANPPAQRVSVALCTCNGSRFLAEQLDSIAQQTRPVDELILCDDHSTDDTLAIARSFQSRIASLQIHQNPARLGVTKNFEQAIARCGGDVIFLCDQDDRWAPTKVQQLLAGLAGGAGLAFCDAQVVREDGQPAGYRLWESIWFTPAEQRRMAGGDSLPVLLKHAVPAGCTLAFVAAYRPLLLPFPDLPHVHDVWISLLLACVSRLTPVTEPLVSYRLHSHNTVGMRRYNWLGQLRMARHQLRTGAFRQLEMLHTAARDRLAGQAQWPVSPAALAQLNEKIRHSRLRDELPPRWSQRWQTIRSEWRAGGYQRFSYGLKSVLQDVFLR